MKVQIDTIQCRRLYERLRSGRAQLEQAQRDVQHARMHLRAQTCPAQKQALRQAEQAIAALEEELERAAFRLFQIAGTYEMYEQSVQSQLRQLPADTLFHSHGMPGDLAVAELPFVRRTWIFRVLGPDPFPHVWDMILALPIPMDPIPRQYRLPEVPARIRDILDARGAEAGVDREAAGAAAAAAASGASRRRRTAVMADRRSPAPLADTERIFPDGG